MRWILLLLPSICLGDCRIQEALVALRPGAIWNLRGETYAGIEWVDKIQAKPTQIEVTTAIAACIKKESDDKAAIISAKAIIADASKTDKERLDALAIYFQILDARASLTTTEAKVK